LYYFSWEVSVLENSEQAEAEAIKALQAKIFLLKQEIVKLQAQLLALSASQNSFICSPFYSDLYFGMNGNQVSCLQQHLKSLGPEIYPEGLVTGYFGPLTQAAVKRYQASQSIITTGYFGPLTRTAVNNQ
ncbi:MAG: peptidoglycan-binding protein, partial [Candidatus Pacebacteria bacterium]|nr:peptidoglycan-binding protein [Candidatus Paceibacterota bacterium]